MRNSTDDNLSRLVRVVIADDHPLMRIGIQRVLEASPEILVIGEATNGTEALIQAQILQPDVLLLDLEMPNLSGVDVARVLHQDFPAIKILVLSAYDDATLIQEVLKAGADGFLTKDEAPIYLVKGILGVAMGITGWLTPQNRLRSEDIHD